ncbi:MAG: winged helix-turn-helix transcriptional regulator [Betaproteobacteria bacterium]|nr:winged helix-turn-helix transcriptional regulator [Betaproteobacteria bacterium]
MHIPSPTPDSPAAPPFSPAALAATGEPLPCTGGRVRKLMRRMTVFYESHLRAAGVKLSQYSLLANLSDTPQSVLDLANRLEMDRTTLTRNLNPLLAAGWVESCTCHDARKREYKLTADGNAAFARARAEWAKAQLALEAQLGRDYVARLNLDLENTLAQLKPALPDDN